MCVAGPSTRGASGTEAVPASNQCKRSGTKRAAFKEDHFQFHTHSRLDLRAVRIAPQLRFKLTPS